MERRHFPEWDDPAECIFHRVAIDLEACDGCRLCTLACPANVLEIYKENGKKKARVKESQRGCISCNNCRAICATGAIAATEANDSVGYYRHLGRGAFEPPRKF
jgi:NAD-dependent dihydropyrimidine dehydrogenase PreA subunit